MLNKIELKDSEQIKKIELKLRKNNRVEIHQKTSWFLFILIMFCILSFIISIILYYLFEDLFPEITMSKLFLDITSENDIAGKTYKINDNTNVMSISHTTWNGLPEFVQNSNIMKLLGQNNSISCFKCNISIPTINKKCIIENDNLFNDGLHNDIWINVRKINKNNFKYKDHNVYSYHCEFRYISQYEVSNFINSIDSQTDIIDISNTVINFERSLHNINNNNFQNFKCNINPNYCGIIFVQNNDVAYTIPYQFLVDELKSKIINILHKSKIPESEKDDLANIIFNRLLGISDFNIRNNSYNQDKNLLNFVITRSQTYTDLYKIKNDDFFAFKNCAIDILNINNKVFTVLNAISNALYQENIFLIIGDQEYGDLNCKNTKNIKYINKKIIIGFKNTIEHFTKKLLNPLNNEKFEIFNLSYIDKNNHHFNINLYHMLNNIDPIDYDLNVNIIKLKNEFCNIYNHQEYYKLIANLYDIFLVPIFKPISNNKIGDNIIKLSVISHTDNSELIEINSNISKNLVDNKILKLTNNIYNYNLLKQFLSLGDLNLEKLTSLINVNYNTEYKWMDIIDPSSKASVMPNLIATDIIRFIETDPSINNIEIIYNLDKIQSCLSILYHWNYIITDLNKLKYIPNKQIIIPDIIISASELENRIKKIKANKNIFFSRKISNNIIAQNIYSLLKLNNLIFECYMEQSNIIQLQNLNGLNIIGCNILIDELISYIIRHNICNSDLKSYINTDVDKNMYINKLKYIQSKDLYFISMPFEELHNLNSNEKNYIFNKINQLPNVIYNNYDNIPRMFFIVSRQMKKAISIDSIPCILGSIIDESTKYSNIAKIIHEIIYPISSNKLNIGRTVLNLLMPEFKFNEDFYQKNNNKVIEILFNIFNTNMNLIITNIKNIKDYKSNLNKINNNATVKFISSKNMTHEILHGYIENYNKSINRVFSKIKKSFISDLLLESIKCRNKNFNQINNIFKESILSIKNLNIKNLKVTQINNKFLHEISTVIKNLNKKELSNFFKQISKSEEEIIKENYDKYKKYIYLANTLHLSPILKHIKSEEYKLENKFDIEQKKFDKLINDIINDCKNFDINYGNKCKSGNKISHLKLQLIDKLYQIVSLFFAN